MSLNQWSNAIDIFSKIKKMRPEEPQVNNL